MIRIAVIAFLVLGAVSLFVLRWYETRKPEAERASWAEIRPVPKQQKAGSTNLFSKELGVSQLAPPQEFEQVTHEGHDLSYYIKNFAQVGVTLIMLPVVLLIILSSTFSTGDKSWAYATAGAILGFWLKQ